MREALIALLALAAGCAPPAEQASPTSGSEAAFLTPDGYGVVHIGMTLPEIEAAMGASLVPGGYPEPQACEIYTIEGVSLAYMLQQGRLTRITDTETADARTPEGVGAGSTDAEVRAAYPNAVEQPAKYADPPAHDLIVWTTPDQRGYRFEIGAEGAVTLVHAGDASILLVEGCS